MNEKSEEDIIDIDDNENNVEEIDEDVIFIEIDDKIEPSTEKPFTQKHYCTSPLHTIPITAIALAKIHKIAEIVNKVAEEQLQTDRKFEVYCYLLGDGETDNHGQYIVTDIIIPRHEAKPNHVDVSEDAIIEVGQYVNDIGMVILGWSHSHGEYDAYSSETDDENHLRILNETNNVVEIDGTKMKYMYEITVNAKHEQYGVVLTQFPCGYISQNNDCEISVIGDEPSEEELESIENELIEIVKNKVEFTIDDDEREVDMDIKDYIGSIIYNKLSVAMDILVNSLGYEDVAKFNDIRKYVIKYSNIIAQNMNEIVDDISENLLKYIKEYNKEI